MAQEYPLLPLIVAITTWHELSNCTNKEKRAGRCCFGTGWFRYATFTVIAWHIGRRRFPGFIGWCLQLRYTGCVFYPVSRRMRMKEETPVAANCMMHMQHLALAGGRALCGREGGHMLTIVAVT